MEQIFNSVEKVNGVLNDFIWGPVMLMFFLFVGIMFTVRTNFFQIAKMKIWLSNTIFACFKDKEVRKTKDKTSISQFQSLCTGLAATIGTGNIAGVATAIASGGPGAVFWMWVSAFFGMMTSFAEKVLGIKYRYKNEKGEWVGGAMIYIEKGLNCKWLAAMFSIFCMLASFGIGNMTQANSISSGLKNAFNIPTYITGIALMIIAALVMLGGIKRIASVTEKLVPFMAAMYIVGGLVVIFANFSNIIPAFQLIFTEAFNFKAAGGGVLGYGISVAMRKGISRGVFSNEAGLGSSVMVHAASDVKEPVVQGMWGVFEVFMDTLVVCTVTALIILTSGVYDMDLYITNMVNGVENVSGIALTSAAFESVIPFGDIFLSISIVLFAFSTILGWSYYGERAVSYLFGDKAVNVYKVMFILMTVVGSVVSLDLAWAIADTLNGFMALPNLIAVTLLSGQVIKMTKDYLKKVKDDKDGLQSS